MTTKYCKLIEQEIHFSIHRSHGPKFCQARIRHHHNEVNQKPRHHVADLRDQIAGTLKKGAMNGYQLR